MVLIFFFSPDTASRDVPLSWAVPRSLDIFSSLERAEADREAREEENSTDPLERAPMEEKMSREEKISHGGNSRLMVDPHGNPPAVVRDCDGVSLMYGHFYGITETCQRLVHRIWTALGIFRPL